MIEVKPQNMQLKEPVRVQLIDPGLKSSMREFESYDDARDVLRTSQYTQAVVRDKANRVIALWQRDPGNPWSYKPVGVLR